MKYFHTAANCILLMACAIVGLVVLGFIGPPFPATLPMLSEMATSLSSSWMKSIVAVIALLFVSSEIRSRNKLMCNIALYLSTLNSFLGPIGLVMGVALVIRHGLSYQPIVGNELRSGESLLYTSVVYALVLIIYMSLRRGIPYILENQLCHNCGYNLAKNESGKCPECGIKFDVKLVKRIQLQEPSNG